VKVSLTDCRVVDGGKFCPRHGTGRTTFWCPTAQRMARIAFEDVESGGPAQRTPVLWVAKTSRRRAPYLDTEAYDYSILIANARTVEPARDVEGNRQGSSSKSWRHGHSARALQGYRGTSQSEGQSSLPCQGSASSSVRRPSRTTASGYLAAEALPTVARDQGIEDEDGDCRFHREAGRAREPGDRAWRLGMFIGTDESLAVEETSHRLISSTGGRVPREHLDPGLAQPGWLPTYFEVAALLLGACQMG
jgi:hypothetical protein